MSTRTPNRRAEVVPLVERVAAMMLVRAGVVGLLLVSGAQAAGGWFLAAAAAYLGITALLSAATLLPSRRWALWGFGVSLLLDPVFLQVAHHRLGHGLPVDLALAAVLVAVCLLGSFRTGLKIAVWQSVLMVTAYQGSVSGVFRPALTAGETLSRSTLVGDLVGLALITLAACSAGALNERELRRRRYDADALRGLATRMNTDQRSGSVAQRLAAFVVEELQGKRALVVRAGEHGFVELASAGWVVGARTAVPGPREVATSAFFDLPPGTHGEVLALGLDPRLDPWLAARLPRASRLVGVPVPVGGTDRVWLVMQVRAVPGVRIERRVVGAVAQACAMAALAMSRAELLEAAERDALVDGLTGVANRRCFDADVAAAATLAAAGGPRVGLVMVDVDHFKAVNDTFGHPVGDAVLQGVARALAQVAGPDGTVYRYGGEEFAVLLPGTTAAEATARAELLRRGVAALEGQATRVTASFGVAVAPDVAAGDRGLIARADAALLRAKQTGRDRVVCAGVPEATAVPATRRAARSA